jgi:hypothetical protein
MKNFDLSKYNNAQKATASLIGVMVCINILPVVAAMNKNNPALPALLSIAAQVFFVMFIYFALIWLRKE